MENKTVKELDSKEIVHNSSGAQCKDCNYFSWNKDAQTGYCSYERSDVNAYDYACRFFKNDY